MVNKYYIKYCGAKTTKKDNKIILICWILFVIMYTAQNLTKYCTRTEIHYFTFNLCAISYAIR